MSFLRRIISSARKILRPPVPRVVVCSDMRCAISVSFRIDSNLWSGRHISAVLKQEALPFIILSLLKIYVWIR